MLIDDNQEYIKIWNQVYEKLKFSPSYMYRGAFFECASAVSDSGRICCLRN